MSVSGEIGIEASGRCPPRPAPRRRNPVRGGVVERESAAVACRGAFPT